MFFDAQKITPVRGCHNIFTLLTEKYTQIGPKRAVCLILDKIKGFFKFFNCNVR